MQILFPIGAFYPSQIGGPCNTIYWHTNELKKHGIDVKIVTTTIGINENEVKCNEFIETEFGKIYYGRGGTKNIKTLRIILSSIKSSDIIHLNSLFNIFSIIPFIYIKLFHSSKKIIWSPRGEISSNALIYSNWKKKPILNLYQHLTKNITFHATSSQEVNDLKNYFSKTKVILFPNFIKSPKRIPQQLKKQLLFIGRIHPIKGIHKLLDALCISEKFMHSDFKLILMGQYEQRHLSYYNQLIMQIKKGKLTNKVLFIGHLIGDDKEKKLAESYFTILPSDSENFGNVVLESLNQGTPVIASLGTPWSILEEFNCGFHTSNDPMKLAKTIDHILGMNIDDYQQLRNNSVKLIDEHFNIENNIKNWIEIYNHCLSE